MIKQNEGEPQKDALIDCEEKVGQLQEENAVLRQAAQTFGDLAERLSKNQRLAHPRRTARRKFNKD